MKSLNEIMAELGFKKDAPIETQKAFIKHLIQSAQVEVQRSEPVAVTSVPAEAASTEKTSRSRKKQTKEQSKEQLQFNFDEVDRVS
jgi:hypothetical protein